MNQTVKRIIKFVGRYYEANRFYELYSSSGCAYSVFFTKKHISNSISILDEVTTISGVCDAYSIIDSNTIVIGYVFVTLKARTVLTPISLAVIIPPEHDSFVEIQLPPKFGILAYKSDNGSTLIVAQEELDLHYIVKDVT